MFKNIIWVRVRVHASVKRQVAKEVRFTMAIIFLNNRKQRNSSSRTLQRDQ